MKPLYIVLVVIYCLICISLIVVTLMQEGKNAGLGSLSGASGDTYWSKNKGRSAEGKLILVTRILATLMIGLSIILALKGWQVK